MGKGRFNLDNPYWYREWVLFNYRPQVWEFEHEHPVRYRISRLKKRACACLFKMRHSSRITGYVLRLMYRYEDFEVKRIDRKLRRLARKAHRSTVEEQSENLENNQAALAKISDWLDPPVRVVTKPQFRCSDG